jgi:hypothetical protein
MALSVKTYKISSLDQPIFNDSTPDIRRVIVDIGCSVYKNLSSITSIKHKQDETETKERYEEEINRIKEHMAHNEESLDTENKTLKEELNTISTHLRAYYDNRSEIEIDRLLTQNNEMISQYKDTISLLKDNIKSLEETKEKQYFELKKFEKMDSLKTVERGIEGEISVIDYLGKTFNEGEMENTTKKGSHGDIHYKYKGTEILIEVKNKDTITLDDISKFKRDILETKPHGGILVSIKTGVNIPCHSIYDVEWVNNVPLIYITNFETCQSMLYTSVKTIHFYNQNSLREDSKDDNRMKEFNNLMDIVRCFSYNLHDLLHDTKRMNERIVKLQNVIKEKVDLSIGVEVQSYEDTIMELLRTYELSNQELPSEEYLIAHGITKKMIKDLNGIKEIKKKYNSINRI